MLARPAGPWVMWRGAAGPCYSGSRCFIGISVGLALVGFPAAAGTTWVPDRSVWAPSVERGGGGNGWADGLTGGALRAGPVNHPRKPLEKFVVLSSARPDAESHGPFCSGVGPTLSWWGAVQWLFPLITPYGRG